jgi:hypothetical protein
MAEYGESFYGSGTYGGEAEPPPVVTVPPIVSVVPTPAAPSTTISDRLYYALLPLAYMDEELGWPLLYYCRSIGEMVQEIDDLVRDKPEGIGWSSIVDTTRVPEKFIDWLGQFIGAQFDQGWSYAQKVYALKDLPGFKRGQLSSMRAAAQQFLTGNKVVVIEEMYTGDPYRVNVVVFTSETPFPTATEKAVRAQKPAGILLTFMMTTGQDYLALRTFHDDYAEVKSLFADYEEVRDNPSGL